MDIKQSKGILARLLAQENLTINHAKVQTASFDTDKRVLTLPIWTDMSGDLYDLLCGHEVGHALETPAQGWHDAIIDSETKRINIRMKGYLNVLEDARIEKKIKLRYPGLRSSFYRAYAELFNKDFFGIVKNNLDIEKLNLIDRINLHFKVGSLLAVKFSPEEQTIVAEVEALETWAEVEALARRLIDRAELEEEEEQQKRAQPGQGELSEEEGNETEGDDGEEMQLQSPDYDADSLTDQAFREREKELVDASSRKFQYMVVPDIDSRPFIVGYKQVMREMVFTADQLPHGEEVIRSFKAKNDRYIGYLIKEFELRRNAEQQARAKISKSGELDLKKVFNYRISEDLFRRFTVLPNGKNHGLLLFFDMSGSMSAQMGAVIEQMLVLVEFCRRASIKFEIYGFTNLPTTPSYGDTLHKRQPFVMDEAHVSDYNFSLRQYFTDAMTGKDYKRQLTNMLLLKKIWDYRARRYQYDSTFDYALPEAEHLNGTPLNPSILLATDIHARFVARTKAEVVNMAWLTDGESDEQMKTVNYIYDDNFNRSSRAKFFCHDSPRHTNVILRHKRSRIEVKLDRNDSNTTMGLIKLTREVTGCNIVCFDIKSSVNRNAIGKIIYSYEDRQLSSNAARVEQLYREYRRERLAVLTETGYNEYYIIPGGQALDIEADEIEVAEQADKQEILRAFRGMQGNKKTSRVLLNRFVKMIA